MNAIELKKVNKLYVNKLGVHNLDLVVAESEIFGFLGPNGAGKTTTIRLMLGFLQPDSGEISLLSHKITLSEKAALTARRELGFLPDNARIDGNYNGAAWLNYLATLQNKPVDPTYRATLCEQLELSTAVLARKIKTYSRGTRQKLAIIQALQHRPKLLIMDEPTEGLDPLAKRALFDLLENCHRQDGTTIFFSSHVLSEVEQLCKRVALLRSGRLVAVESIATLRNRQTRRIEITFDEASPAFEQEINAKLQQIIAAEANFAETDGSLQQEGERWKLALRGDLNPLLGLLAAYPVRDLIIEPADLEDIFLSYYRE